MRVTKSEDRNAVGDDHGVASQTEHLESFGTTDARSST
jgi:hypothetical protein